MVLSARLIQCMWSDLPLLSLIHNERKLSQIHDEAERRDSTRRTRVLLQADKKSRPDGWHIAVFSPMFDAGAANWDKERRRLDVELKKARVIVKSGV